MPEYWIIAVHYEENAIATVRVAKAFARQAHFTDVASSDVEEVTRETVEIWIAAGSIRVHTGLVGYGNATRARYRRGAEVTLGANNEFLTTEADGTVYNNLSHLPRY